MKKRFLFSLTRVVISVLFYFSLVVAVFVLVSGIVHMTSGWETEKTPVRYVSKPVPFGSGTLQGHFSLGPAYDAEVTSSDFRQQSSRPPVRSADGHTAYMPLQHRYGVSIDPNSPFGHSLFLFRLALVTIGVLILWNLKQIFRHITTAEGFRGSVVKRLKILALLFIGYDLLKWLDYLVFDHFIDIAFPEAQLRMITTVGRGLFIALILWVIAVVYERGIFLEQENALTI
jgi:hypothetical protein